MKDLVKIHDHRIAVHQCRIRGCQVKDFCLKFRFWYQCSIHEMAILEVFGPFFPQIWIFTRGSTKEKKRLKNLWEITILMEIGWTQKLYIWSNFWFNFWSLKMAKIERKKIIFFQGRTLAIGLSKYVKTKPLAPLPFKWKGNKQGGVKN